MKDYVIIVDSSADLAAEYYEKNDVKLMPITYVLDNKNEYPDDAGVSMAYGEFYRKMRDGAKSTTSMINVERYLTEFDGYLKDGKDIVCIPLSSGISGSYNAATIAARELQEKYHERTVAVVDSLNASLGHGLLTHVAVRKRDEGMSAAELQAWLEENRLFFHALFTVDDLMFLQRGGRISKTAAVLGGLIGVKPMLYIDEEGRLTVSHKKRGRRGALEDLVESMEKLAEGRELETVAVSHGDCEADADFVIGLVREKFKVGTILKNYIGPVIGSHSGPGTVALFFVGKKREKRD